MGSAEHIKFYILCALGLVRKITLERGTIEGNSPVFENYFVLLVIYLEYHGK